MTKSQSRQRYQIVRKIDAGGMAEIYVGKAQSIEGMQKQVAIKRVLPHLSKNEQFIGMFLDEARLSMRLSHANIVQVFDVGRSGATYFIVMEFVDGYNLRKVFQRAVELGFRIPLETVCFVVMEASKGLAHAHELKDENGKHLHIVHRDISPPNIMISKAGEVKVTDFGLAKAMTQLSTTDPGVVKGKFSYLAPEAAEGQTVDHRADIFATGVVLWELLANRRLFLGKSDLETVEMVKAAKVPPLSKFNAQVTPEFEQIVGRSLEKDPRKRYTTQREFGEAIANYLYSHKLKVTGYDLAGMVQRLFGDNAAELEPPEERIATLIQEEILNLSMLGKQSQAAGVDASKELEPNKLGIEVRARFDLEPFWKGSAAPKAKEKGKGRSKSVTAMEAVQSPSELANVLEGESVVGKLPTADSGGGGSKTGLYVTIAVLALGAIAAAVYFLVLAPK